MTDNDFDFSVDTQNLYREEGFTDLKVASIRRLVPVKPDGSDDKTRTPIFVGSTQLMSPEGPLPVQARLAANNLIEAMAEFPAAMKTALAELIQQLEEIQQQEKGKNDSRIIVPGR